MTTADVRFRDPERERAARAKMVGLRFCVTSSAPSSFRSSSTRELWSAVFVLPEALASLRVHARTTECCARDVVCCGRIAPG